MAVREPPRVRWATPLVKEMRESREEKRDRTDM
jgi:hypothetical protein